MTSRMWNCLFAFVFHCFLCFGMFKEEENSSPIGNVLTDLFLHLAVLRIEKIHRAKLHALAFHYFEE